MARYGLLLGFVLLLAIACGQTEAVQYDLIIKGPPTPTPTPTATPYIDPTTITLTPTIVPACLTDMPNEEPTVEPCPTITPTPTPTPMRGKRYVEFKQRGAEQPIVEIDLDDINIQGIELLPTATRTPRPTPTPTLTPTPVKVSGWVISREGSSSEYGYIYLAPGVYDVELTLLKGNTATAEIRDGRITITEVGESATGVHRQGIDPFRFSVVSNDASEWRLTFSPR